MEMEANYSNKRKMVGANCRKNKVNCSKRMVLLLNCSNSKRKERKAKCSKRKIVEANYSKRKMVEANCSKNKVNCSKRMVLLLNCCKSRMITTTIARMRWQLHNVFDAQTTK